MSLSQKIKFKPRFVIFATIIAAICVIFNINYYGSQKVISYDVSGYYSYLPSVFYFNDLSQEFLNQPENLKYIERFHYPPKTPDGKPIFKGTMGMSVSYLPFFALAHVWCKISGDETDGYSPPYHLAIQLSSLFYFVIGLWYLLKILRNYFPESSNTFSLLIIVFGTNAFYYITIGAGMSHAVNFALCSMFIYYTLQWHLTPTVKTSIAVGLIGGLLTLIRPINILVFIFFFLYRIKSVKDLRLQFSFMFSNYSKIFLIAVLGILVFLPQLLYWKYQTGAFFYNSYVGERFYFNQPHLIDGLFSFRKGWLIYTPVMFFALIGFISLFRDRREFFLSIILLTAIYMFIAWCWWCWWYGGSFGQRALIDIYPFLILPLASAITKIMNLPAKLRTSLYTLITALILLNLFQTAQAKWNTIHYDSMTREAYFDAFLRLTKNPEREKFLKHPDYKSALLGIDEY